MNQTLLIMTKKNTFKVFLLLFILFLIGTIDAQSIPLVYSVQNTGADCADPILPSFDDLPVIRPLTDPFQWSDGSGRVSDFSDWQCRRAEIAMEIQNYEIGFQPPTPESMEAEMEGDSVLHVNIFINGDTMKLSANIILPEGDGPFPALLGVGGGPSGALSSEIFTSRNIALIQFNHNQITQHTQVRGSEPINQYYPDYEHIGSYSAWPWGASRIIDGLEMVQDQLPIDLAHLGVTGCSWAGKLALFIGAFDERIALTIVQESGGGGAAAWRVSETLGNVETLGNTSFSWFLEDMRLFANSVNKLPHDHHELLSMVAPRALLYLGNPDYEWLAEQSGYVSCKAASEVYKAFGIEDRFGFSIVDGHGHCALPDSQLPEVTAFIDKFLVGDTTANTDDIAVHEYETVDDARWLEWWGTDDPSFPDIDTSGLEFHYFEAECASPGGDWLIVQDEEASNGAYITVMPGTQSLGGIAETGEGQIDIPFTVEGDSIYYLYARLNCPSADDDSYWISIDGGEASLANGLGTNGWEWVSILTTNLEAGEHTLTFSYREDGALMDKLVFTTYPFGPEEPLGAEALNLCDPMFTVGNENEANLEGYSLDQNFPNPFNERTNITFELPSSSYVSLKLYNVDGVELAELADSDFTQGQHTIDFKTDNLPDGLYLYTLRAGAFVSTKYMVIHGK